MVPFTTAWLDTNKKLGCSGSQRDDHHLHARRRRLQGLSRLSNQLCDLLRSRDSGRTLVDNSSSFDPARWTNPCDAHNPPVLESQRFRGPSESEHPPPHAVHALLEALCQDRQHRSRDGPNRRCGPAELHDSAHTRLEHRPQCARM